MDKLTPEDVEAAMRAELDRMPVIGRIHDPAATAQQLAEVLRRQGVPVVRAYVEGTGIVCTVATPAGEG